MLTENARNYLFWKDCNIFVEWLRGADVAAGHAGVPRRAGRQLALLEDEGQQGEQRVPAIREILVIRVLEERLLNVNWNVYVHKKSQK